MESLNFVFTSSEFLSSSNSLIRQRCLINKNIRYSCRNQLRTTIQCNSAAASNGTHSNGSVSQEEESAKLKRRYDLIRVDLDALGVNSEVENLQKVDMKSTRKALFALFKYVKSLSDKHGIKYYKIVAALAVMMLSKVLLLLRSYLYKLSADKMLNAVSNASNTVPFAANMLAKHAILLMMAYGVVRMFASLAHELRNVFFATEGQRLGRLINISAFKHIHSMDSAFHSHSRSGALVQIIDRGTKSLMVISRSVIFSFFPSLIELIMVCTVLAKSFSPVFSLLTVLTFMTYIVVTVKLNQSLSHIRKSMMVMDREGMARLSDSLYNVETVKLFGNTQFEADRYNEYLRNYEKFSVKNEYFFSALNFAQNGIFTLGFTGMLTLSLMKIYTGSMTFGDVLMLATLLEQLWQPLNFIGWQYRELKQAVVEIENLMDVLSLQSSITDKVDAKPLEIDNGEIVFDNVQFAYTQPSISTESKSKTRVKSNGRSRAPVLKGVSFTVPAGKTVAIVGSSGGGKSSTLRLIQRLYDPTEGRVLIDGQDLRDVTQESLRRNIGMISQNISMFNDTLYFNIAYGRPDATMEQVEQAAKLAHIHDTIMAMPQGYASLVGERGVMLSGGERQRVAIARCLLENPKILLCDEATSSLDSKTEENINQSLRELQQNRTCVIVAHRLSTVIHADNILVMKDGRIAESGTHSELLSIPNGIYPQMFNQQKALKRPPEDNVVQPKNVIQYN